MKRAIGLLTVAAALFVACATGSAQSAVGNFISLYLNGNRVVASGSGTATVTVPNSTDTLVGKATTDTLTNKTLNAESTGNVLTVPEKWVLLAATCEGGAPYFPNWSGPLAAMPTATCIEGTNVTIGQADFSDGGTQALQASYLLPADWTGAIDLALLWRSTATSGNVVWQVQTACSAVSETVDPSWNAAQTITDATQGTASRLNAASLTNVTTTGCAAGEWLYLSVFRDPSHASDTLGAVASLLVTEWTFRRAL